jgi:hypothetical protein
VTTGTGRDVLEAFLDFHRGVVSRRASADQLTPSAPRD